MKKVKIILVLLVFFTITCLAQKSKRPNILFILSDDHTSQAWGIYGGILKDYVKNQNIKWLADHGVVLNNAFCTNSICTPSRATILTGQYSHINGVYNLDEPLSPQHPNVAKLLQTGGYQTAVIGKWHLVKEPTGFYYYSILPGQGKYRNPILINRENWIPDSKGGKEFKGFSDDVITSQAIDWLKQSTDNKPFYLSVNFKGTHEPYDYPERYNDFLDNVELPYPKNIADSGHNTTGRIHDGWPLEILGKRYVKSAGITYPGPKFVLNETDYLADRKKIYQKFIKDFLRCGATIDENIGKLIAYLKQSGQLENTIIIYTADQGYFLGEHNFFDKRFMYEESLRMPFVISYPKELKPKKRVDDMILNIDFAPLLLDYAGIKRPDYMQGKSFRSNLNGKTPANWRKDMYYRYWANDVSRPAHFGIRTDRYKLILFYGQARTKVTRDSITYGPGWEFYDLKKDPNENHNAINDLQYQNTIKQLKKRLKIIKTESGDGKENNKIIKDIVDQFL